MSAQHGIHAELRRQPMEVTSLLPPCGPQVSNSGNQAWWQAPLPADHLTGPCVLASDILMV